MGAAGRRVPLSGGTRPQAHRAHGKSCAALARLLRRRCWELSPLEFFVQPRACDGPFAFDGHRRNVECLGSLRNGKAGKVAQLHHPRFLGVGGGEFGEGDVERDHFEIARHADGEGVLQCDPRGRASALGCALFARVVHQDAPDDLRRRPKEGERLWNSMWCCCAS